VKPIAGPPLLRINTYIHPLHPTTAAGPQRHTLSAHNKKGAVSAVRASITIQGFVWVANFVTFSLAMPRQSTSRWSALLCAVAVAAAASPTHSAVPDRVILSGPLVDAQCNVESVEEANSAQVRLRSNPARSGLREAVARIGSRRNAFASSHPSVGQHCGR